MVRELHKVKEEIIDGERGPASGRHGWGQAAPRVPGRGPGGPAGEAIWGPGPGASGLVLWFRSSTPFSN